MSELSGARSIEKRNVILGMAISPAVRFWALVVPFIVWLGLHRWGNFGPVGDNNSFFCWVTYHFDYLSQGVFPLWDPYRSWGCPDITDARIFGVFCPFYLVIPLLSLLGVPTGIGFNIFLIIYYWWGLLGFYLLVRRVVGAELPACKN